MRNKARKLGAEQGAQIRCGTRRATFGALELWGLGFVGAQKLQSGLQSQHSNEGFYSASLRAHAISTQRRLRCSWPSLFSLVHSNLPLPAPLSEFLRKLVAQEVDRSAERTDYDLGPGLEIIDPGAKLAVPMPKVRPHAWRSIGGWRRVEGSQEGTAL